MVNCKWAGLVAALAFFSWQNAAHASIVRADFSEVLDLPGLANGPRVEASSNVSLPSAGPQLTAANTISNPSPWNTSLNVIFDPTTNILSLTGDGSNTYTTVNVSLSNLVFSNGSVVTGIAPISTGNAVHADQHALSVTEGYTSNSFDVSYVAGNGYFYAGPSLFAGYNYFDIGPSTDTFQVTLSSAAPEPSTWAMLMLGVFGAGALLRRRRQQGPALA